MGMLGAATSAAGLLPSTAYASLGDTLNALRSSLDSFTRDTFNGLSVFVVPGPDAYSRAQGTPRPEPGAMEMATTPFLIKALDGSVPFPSLSQPVAAALASGLAATPLPLPTAGLSLSEVEALGPITSVDQAVTYLLRNNQTIPLSQVVALLVDFLAIQVNPASAIGPFQSPFPRLTFAQKAQAMSLLEGGDSNLVALLDTQLPQSAQSSVSGFLKFIAGALLEFAAAGSYSEFSVFDPATRTLSGRPLGWQLTGYLPNGVVEGWDDFHGYFQNRTEVTS
jgi:hypothetical protein